MSVFLWTLMTQSQQEIFVERISCCGVC